MSQKNILSVLIAAMIMLGGCAAIVDQQLIDKPSVRFEGFSLNSASLFEATPTFLFKIVNTNPIGLKIRNISYNLKINDKKFIKGVTDKDIRLKPVSSERLGLSVTFNLSDLFIYSTEFIQTGRIAYDLSGNIGVGAFAAPYQTKGYLEIPKLPEVSLSYVDACGFSLMGNSTIVFVLNLKNANAFPVQIPELGYRIKIAEKEFISGIVREIPSIDKNSSISLKIPMRSDFSEPDWPVNTMLAGGSLPYDLSGNMKFYTSKKMEKNFPFQNAGEVSFRKK
jgi:LEA14-like dessication related protein